MLQCHSSLDWRFHTRISSLPTPTFANLGKKYRNLKEEPEKTLLSIYLDWFIQTFRIIDFERSLTIVLQSWHEPTRQRGEENRTYEHKLKLLFNVQQRENAPTKSGAAISASAVGVTLRSQPCNWGRKKVRTWPFAQSARLRLRTPRAAAPRHFFGWWLKSGGAIMQPCWDTIHWFHSKIQGVCRWTAEEFKLVKRLSSPKMLKVKRELNAF